VILVNCLKLLNHNMKLLSTLALSSTSLLSIIPHIAAHPSNALSATPRAKQPLPLPVEIIYEFPPQTWVENLAVRSNGKVLVTLLTTPDLYQIDPSTPHSAPILVHHFSEHKGLFGITETTPDIFYLVGGNYSSADKANPNPVGAYDIYEVDLRNGATNAVVTKIANLPNARLLNGMTTFCASTGIVLIADSFAGLLYRLDTQTKQVSVAIDDPTMKAPAAGPSPFGINGVKIRDGFLYFTNTATSSLVKIPISPIDASATGPAIVLSTDAKGDDFILDRAGDAFIAENNLNNLAFLPPQGGNVTVLAGAPFTNATVLAGPTACAFGRLPRDRKSLYITTSAGIASGVKDPMLGGTLSKVDLRGSGYYNRGEQEGEGEGEEEGEGEGEEERESA